MDIGCSLKFKNFFGKYDPAFPKNLYKYFLFKHPVYINKKQFSFMKSNEKSLKSFLELQTFLKFLVCFYTIKEI
jgi:hypothetical protein